MAVIEDIINGARVGQGPNGFFAERVFHVDGLTGNANARISNALSTTGVPQNGEPHPVLTGIRVVNREARPITKSSTQAVMITISYEQLRISDTPPDETQPPQIQVGGSVESVTTQLDINGEQITTEHTFEDTDEDGNVTTRTETQGGEVDIQVPAVVFRLTRREAVSPAQKARTFMGKLNAGTFSGDEAGFWLCTRIEGVSDDGGETYTVTYEFQRNRDGWGATVVFIDKDTGRPPPDLVEDVGIKTVVVYESIDFGELNLGV